MLSIDELHYRRVSFEGDENNERKSHRFFRGNPHDNIMTTIRMCTMISLNAFITSVTRKWDSSLQPATHRDMRLFV